MKYIVMEIQTAFDGAVGNLVTAYDTQADAEVAYYYILAAAVKSNLMMHTAILLTNDGNVIMAKNYVHESQPNNE